MAPKWESEKAFKINVLIESSFLFINSSTDWTRFWWQVCSGICPPFINECVKGSHLVPITSWMPPPSDVHKPRWIEYNIRFCRKYCLIKKYYFCSMFNYNNNCIYYTFINAVHYWVAYDGSHWIQEWEATPQFVVYGKMTSVKLASFTSIKTLPEIVSIPEIQITCLRSIDTTDT